MLRILRDHIKILKLGKRSEDSSKVPPRRLRFRRFSPGESKIPYWEVSRVFLRKEGGERRGSGKEGEAFPGIPWDLLGSLIRSTDAFESSFKIFTYIFLVRLYLFLFRERGRERNINL